MKLPRVPLLFAVPLLLCACAGMGAGGNPATTTGQYTLQPAQRQALGESATLTYDSFSDSRCPPAVQCMWAGELVYRFTLATPKVTESFALGSNKPEYVSQALDGARISIDPGKLPAPPQAGAALQPHPVTVTVARPQ